MARLPPELFRSELAENMASLKESARVIHDTVSAHEPVHVGWGTSAIFKEKLKLHKKLASLVRQQQALAEGIVSLISEVHDFEDEKLKRQQPVLPPAPRPTRPITLPGGGSSPQSTMGLPPLSGDPSFINKPKKKGLKAFFSKK